MARTTRPRAHRLARGENVPTNPAMALYASQMEALAAPRMDQSVHDLPLPGWQQADMAGPAGPSVPTMNPGSEVNSLDALTRISMDLEQGAAWVDELSDPGRRRCAMLCFEALLTANR
jgi:hypothetical protein